ncbi:MAG TPA: thioredoxin [Candidatus Methylomirabilis sp.]|nr:thioredoxin [Candidatus Methylomirabilis sp.]
MTESEMVHLTTDTFDEQVLTRREPVLVDFWAEWCVPCKALIPVLEGIAREMAGSAVIGKVNVEEEPAIASRFGVQALPSLLFFKDGKLVDTLVGRVPKAVLVGKLKDLGSG